MDESRTPTLTDSKLGGVPYWDSQQAYPADSNGNPLVLLAQFNLRELPETNLLPQTGLLQFFLLDDRYYGLPLLVPVILDNWNEKRRVLWGETGVVLFSLTVKNWLPWILMIYKVTE